MPPTSIILLQSTAAATVSSLVSSHTHLLMQITRPPATPPFGLQHVVLGLPAPYPANVACGAESRAELHAFSITPSAWATYQRVDRTLS
jgi:hypothetical protein